MGRKAKTIEGAISDVREVEPHKGQFRIRFKLNGVPTEAYRAKEEDANAVHADLSTRAILKEGTKKTVITELSLEQVRQAEFAFEILAAAGLLDRATDERADLIRIAAQKYAEAVKAQGPAIKAGEAYTQFIAHAKSLNRSPKTIKDYDRFILRGFLGTHGEQLAYLITSADCHSYVMGHRTQLDRFKSYAYLSAFLSFCAGKNNPAIDPTKENAWISQSPINFPKPALELKDIESYSLKEITAIFAHALKNQNKGLGYLVFRLFSLCRYDELERFVAIGGGSGWETNKFIDLKNNRIIFNPEVYKKRSGGQARGRTIKIHPTFRAWIDYCIQNGIGFNYDGDGRDGEENARRSAVPLKFGKPNLLRHTAITMHLKAFKNASDTAHIAGTSTEKIDTNYYNSKITEQEASKLYKLTPKALNL